jgi:hypothetical protein
MIGTFDESAVVYQVSDKYDANTMDHATDPALIQRFMNTRSTPPI